mmetsp:Transcript_89582/g.248766  ORF Transcript_89582/g.248766 Transcript_89582/m.248766 type:complete len:551 (+) Transcript_89582:102-1754(+)
MGRMLSLRGPVITWAACLLALAACVWCGRGVRIASLFCLRLQRPRAPLRHQLRSSSIELSPVHTEFPRALVRSAHIDEDAVETACASLVKSVLNGNVYQFEALSVVLRSMMPPSSGANKIRGPPPEATIEKSDLVWSENDFMSGPQENLRILQGFEAEYARRVAYAEDGFRDPKVLEGALDLAVAYLKNYAVDKADALYGAIEPYCMERGLPWDVKWLQDCATLRCKQARQQEAAVLLEEVAKRTPPHPATLNNLGTVYNMLRQHEKAQEYFKAAQEVAGHQEPEKDDLWNMGIAKKNLGEYEEALPMLEKALKDWQRDDPHDDVTLAKLHDTVGSCYDLMGRAEDAVYQFSQARMLFGRSIGAESPLYGSACEGLTKALIHAGRYAEAFDRLEETFLNNAEKDAIHPTPLFELLGYALEDLVSAGHLDAKELGRLEAPIEIAVKNMIHRSLDQDGNAGVVFERMAQVLLRCSMAEGDEEQQRIAARRREFARYLLNRAAPLVEACTRSGEADLTHITTVIRMELQVLDSQDALYRKVLGSAVPVAPALP